MIEKRESVRVNPPEGSLVVNQLTQTKVGRIIDISSSGFLLAGREKIKSGMIFQLELVIIGANNTHVNVGAECIWADLQTSGLTFGGFQIIDITDKDQTTLEEIIEQLATH
ncbi:MAG: PilZ domain-containing protein [Marinicella sp.]